MAKPKRENRGTRPTKKKKKRKKINPHSTIYQRSRYSTPIPHLRQHQLKPAPQPQARKWPEGIHRLNGYKVKQEKGAKKNKSLEKTNESTKRFSWISNFKYCILAFVSWGDQPQLKPSRHPSDARTDWYISHGTNVLAPDPHARSKPCPIRDSNRLVVPTGKFKLTRVEGVDQYGDKKKQKEEKKNYGSSNWMSEKFPLRKLQGSC